ncbi:MAG: chemotaxis protein CheW [Candidatus Korobacteraceae bacterium]|jgi:chemotaxis signal transduction protein
MSGWANPAQGRRGEAAVIFRAGGQRFIISSAEIAEVRDLQPSASGRLPRAIATRGNLRQLPVVWADSVFGVRSAAPLQLLVLAHRGVAVVIERIEGVTELREMVALPRAFHGPERRWYRGLARFEGKILPVVNAAVFAELAVSPVPIEAAASAAGSMEAKAGL